MKRPKFFKKWVYWRLYDGCLSWWKVWAVDFYIKMKRGDL